MLDELRQCVMLKKKKTTQRNKLEISEIGPYTNRNNK